MLDRAAELITEARAELQEIRISIAQLRDGMLTMTELAVIFDVYEEFGR